ncbi:MAG: asparagine synthase (glutamine-hydrolyzing) [Pseudohaliea sp.]
MCGIAGFTRFHQSLGDEATLDRMADTIRHRGPNAGGSWLAEQVGLAHRRLSIIDLSAAGNQPMHSADGKLAIVFNGEIYNFQAQRDELAAAGYRFRTGTDTEVILALYARDGVRCLERLNGMFAFALWDATAQRLFLARDRLGKKPLYYTFLDGDIAFASELKALLTLPQVPRRVRTDAVYDYFAYQYVPDPKTIFEGVFKLEPGHYLEVDTGGAKATRYWDIPGAVSGADDEDRIAEALRQRIHAATRRRMVADVPLGAFLSGGVDSSGIVAAMAQQNPPGAPPITTCAIGFANERFDETDYARRVAEQYRTTHHELTVEANVRDNLRAIARFFDEPFADPSLVPTFFVSQLAREKVTVAIAGDGGDEVFAGYEKYAIDAVENRLRERLPRWLRRALAPLAGPLRLVPLRLCRRAATLLHTLAQSPAMGFYLSNAQITDGQWRRLCRRRTRDSLGGYHPSQLTLDAYARSGGPDHLARILYTDFKTYLPGDILVKVDRMSMANSLEVRAPLLDYTLVELAARLPSNLKLRDGEKKYILKRVFEKDLPADILYRRKMGFSVPLADWLRGELKELAEDALFNSPAGIRDYFKPRAVRRLWRAHQRGRADHSTVLWSLLMFQLWWDAYMPAEPPAAEGPA